jgi:periplasmic protein TonB
MVDTLFDRSEPRLPGRTAAGTAAQVVTSAVMHLATLAVIVAAVAGSHPPPPVVERDARAAPPPVLLPQIVFRMPERAGGGGGGGGGGNRNRAPIRHAEDRGHDQATLRTRPTPPTTGVTAFEPVEQIPAVLLDARPLASGTEVHAGLPVGGVSFGDSQGPGSGGGVGTGTGTGIGSGAGPGIGPGSGGGIGGGVYRPGGSVTTPRLLLEVKPKYSADALRQKIEGAVWLDLVVTRSGVPSNVRVVRSLDPGLDQEAVAAMLQWRFAPGMLAGSPVDVEVVVQMTFMIR